MPWESADDVPQGAGLTVDVDAETAASPGAKDQADSAVSRSSDHSLDIPPPYSQAARSASTPDDVSSPSSPLHRTQSSAKSSTMSHNGTDTSRAVRVHTIGSDLKSGFPYHPALFDLRVRPDEWERFTHEVVETTKFSMGDHAKLWASATFVALTGNLVSSIWVGKNMNRSLQERKAKSGLQDMSDGGLGDTLQQWNSTYFKDLGVFAHLELSEHATKQKSKSSKGRSPSDSKEERQRKKEEKKFVIVVSRLNGDGVAAETLQELDVTGDAIDLPVQHDPKNFTAELPGDEGCMPVELPAGMPNMHVKATLPLESIAELPA